MFPEKGNMGKVLPEYLSNWTTEKVKTGSYPVSIITAHWIANENVLLFFIYTY